MESLFLDRIAQIAPLSGWTKSIRGFGGMSEISQKLLAAAPPRKNLSRLSCERLLANNTYEKPNFS